MAPKAARGSHKEPRAQKNSPGFTKAFQGSRKSNNSGLLKQLKAHHTSSWLIAKVTQGSKKQLKIVGQGTQKQPRAFRTAQGLQKQCWAHKNKNRAHKAIQNSQKQPRPHKSSTGSQKHTRLTKATQGSQKQVRAHERSPAGAHKSSPWITKETQGLQKQPRARKAAQGSQKQPRANKSSPGLTKAVQG